MFILTFDVESAYALNPSLESDKNWQIWLEETLTSITQITQILKRHEVPATFFIVGKVIERAGQDLVDLLDNNLLFDIGSHTYSHMGILSDNSEVLQQLDPELVKTSELILKYFGRKPLGFCAPGGFYRGLQGHPKQLGILWNHGHRFIRTDGVGPPEQPMPALIGIPKMVSLICLKYQQLAGTVTSSSTPVIRATVGNQDPVLLMEPSWRDCRPQ